MAKTSTDDMKVKVRVEVKVKVEVAKEVMRGAICRGGRGRDKAKNVLRDIHVELQHNTERDEEN